MKNETQLTDEVRQWMTPSVISIFTHTAIREALETLRDDHVSALPVVDDAGNLAGIVTIADFLRAVIVTDEVLDSEYPHYDDCLWAVDLIQRKLGTDPVGTLMSEVLITVRPDQTMEQAACILLRNQLHHLPVCDAHGELVGLLSTTDFVRMACNDAANAR